MSKDNDQTHGAPYEELPPGRVVISDLSTEVVFQQALMREIAEYYDLDLDDEEADDPRGDDAEEISQAFVAGLTGRHGN